MAYEHVEKALTMPDLDPKERLVLAFLAKCYNRVSKRCHPKVATIAKNISLSERTVYSALSSLKEKGHVVVLKKGYPGKGYPGRANLYDLPTLVSASPANSSTLQVEQAESASFAGDHLHLQQSNQEGEPVKGNGKKTSGYPLSLYEQKNPKTHQDQEKAEEPEPPLKAAPPPVALAPLPTSGDTQLATRWKEGVAKLGLAAVVTGSQSKMLKGYANAVGYENALKLIPFIIERWSKFTQHTKYYAGAFNPPSHPNIGYLCKYADKSVEFFEAETKPKPLEGFEKIVW